MKYLDICSALYDYTAQNDEEISFKVENILYILEKEDPDWYKAQLKVPNVDGPIGLIPANYIEKAKSIGSIKAIYDYEARSAEELTFKEDEILTLYEKDDPDWFVVENSQGNIGLVPSNYVEETTIKPKIVKEEIKTTPVVEPKWAIALYTFQPESTEETYLEDHEQVLVTNYENKDWWTIEHKNGKSGIVPANYIKFQDQYEADLKAEEEEEFKKQREKDLAERKLQREQEEKERERQVEAERRRKMQEEAKQKEIEAKRQASFAANNVASPQLGSPRRSQIPAPPPPTKVVPEHNDPNKPDPSKVRLWTDRTGAFKVEAQFLSCANGKIRLFKTNGVKIDVPTEKMCMEDLKYIESETGQRLIDDKSDNIPLGQLNVRFSWLEYFKKANLPRDDCTKYAKLFESNGLSERDIERLTHYRMKSLGMTERHVRRIQRFIETNRAEPPSEDESERPKKVKKSVTFGAVSYIEDDNYDDNYDEGSVQWQIEQDEKLARQLQEQEQGPSVNLQRRGTGRPTPAQSAPRGVNSAALTSHQFNHEPLKPTPVTPTHTPLQPSPVKSNNVPTPPPKFEDDAWAPRSSPSTAPSAPPAWNQSSSTSSSVPATTTPPQMPPRQRPTPQISQQSLVDPQLLAKWGGSPALAAANTRPVPPPPPSNFAPSPNHQALNSLPIQQNSTFYQQPVNNNNGFTSQAQHQLPTSGSFTTSQTQLPTGNSFSSGQVSVQQQLPTAGSFSSLQQVPNNNFVQQQLSTGQFGAPIHSGSFSSLPTGNFQQTSTNFQHQAPTHTGSFSSLQPTTFQPATHQFQQPTGYTAPVYNNSPSLQPSNASFMSSTSSLQSQLTGASWASATPANPFGGASPQVTNVPQYHTAIDPNDKYSVFKTVDTTTPSIFNKQQNFYH